MNKKALILTAVTALSVLTGCKDKGTVNTTESETQAQTASTAVQDITVWVSDDMSAVTKAKLDEWLTTTEWNGRVNITVSEVSEEEAAGRMLKDTASGADIYSFSQDQLVRLVRAGALDAPDGEYPETISGRNDEGAVDAVSCDGKIYAYPESSESGYFLYYDKSVVKDPSTLEGILADCEAADKKLYMDLQSGWYNASFFFATGADCSYDCDSSGNITQAVCRLDSDEGLTAMKAVVDLVKRDGFAQTTGADAARFDPDGGTAGALISGLWDEPTVSGLLGSNYGAAELPTFTAGGKTYHMSGFGSYRMIGVRPQDDSVRREFCHAAADFLAGENMQSVRYDQNGWIPTDVNVRQDRLKNDRALSAMTAQLRYSRAQGIYPSKYWDITEKIGKDITGGMYSDASDDELREALAEYAAELKDIK